MQKVKVLMVIAFMVKSETWNVAKDLNQTQKIKGGMQSGGVPKTKLKPTSSDP